MSEAPALVGKTAIVTGASSGIGRAIAERLGRAGARVVLVGRSAAPMEASQKVIEEAGGRASVQAMDVRDTARLQELVAEVADGTGRLDIMVNNAGLSYPSKITEADPEEWQEMFDVNVIALLAGCQAAVKAMRETESDGHIVNVSSVAALRSNSGVYGSTKHAVNAISSTLREELEEDSIRVCTVMPGAIATNFARNFAPEFLQGFTKMTGIDVEVKQGEKLPDEVFEKLQNQLSQMLCDPTDVAESVYYAVTQPIQVNVEQIVVRPPKQMNL